MQYEPIQYRDFYDVPRMFIVRFGDNSYLFDCKFNEHKDEYDTHCSVFLMPPLDDAALAGDWRKFPSIPLRLAVKVSVSDVKFDATKRNGINTDIFDQLGGN